MLSQLRIHNPDCAHCNAREPCWGEMRIRLEELNWCTQPVSPKNDEVLAAPDAKLLNL